MAIEGVTIDNVLHGLEIISILAGGFAVAFRLGRTTSRIEEAMKAQNIASSLQSAEISDLKKELKKLADVLTTLAVQETRLDMHDKWIDEIRRGVGLIRSPIKSAQK